MCKTVQKMHDIKNLDRRKHGFYLITMSSLCPFDISLNLFIPCHCNYQLKQASAWKYQKKKIYKNCLREVHDPS